MNLLDLFVKVGVDDQASGQLESISTGAIAKATAIGNAMYDIAKGVASTAISGLTAIGQGAVEGYQQYEQLWGGIQKLYGNANMSLQEYADAAGKSIDQVAEAYERNQRAEEKMAEYAKNAWRTVQMSANDYMDTATSFSAALVNSLGGDTEAAAEKTDKAMRAIADNYNTFGSDIESVKNAFMGFSKQNFSMLDNLKLGYGGTKDEMEKLINDANEYAKSIGEASDLSIDSFADIVDAIELIQKKQQIFGTSNREALSTIEGSANAAKAAWSNLLTAIGSGDESAIQDSVHGIIVSLFGTWDDEVGKKTGGLVNNLIPVVQNVANAVGEQLPSVAETLAYQFMDVFADVLGIDGAVADEFIENLSNQIGEGRLKIAAKVEEIKSTISGMFDNFKQSAGIESFTDIFGQITQALSDFTNGLSGTNAFDDFGQRVEGLGTVLGQVWTWIQENILANAGSFGETLGTAFERAKEVFDGVSDAVSSFIETVDWGYVNVAIGELQSILEQLWSFVEQNILPHMPEIGEALGTVANVLGELGTTVLTVIDNLGPFMPAILAIAGVLTAWGPIAGIIGTIAGAFTTFTTVIVPALAAVQSLGGVFALVGTLLGGWIPILIAVVAGIAAFLLTNEDARAKIAEIWESIKTFFGDAISAIGSAIAQFINDVIFHWKTMVADTKAKWDESVATAKEWIENLKSSISEGVENVVNFFVGLPERIMNALGDLGSLLWNAGTQIIEGLLGGLQEKWESAKEWFANITDAIPNLKGPKEKDAKLLKENGKAIMKGLDDGIKEGFVGVKGTLGNITKEISKGVNVSAKVDAKNAKSKKKDKEMLGILAKIEANIGNDIYLDGKTLVGSTAPAMNRAMARL